MKKLATFVVGAALLTGCGPAATDEAVDKAYDYCEKSVPQDAEAGAFGTNPDPAQFKQDVEEAFDHCVDIRIDYYVDNPDAP